LMVPMIKHFRGTYLKSENCKTRKVHYAQHPETSNLKMAVRK
jgi:hypothetical protein